MKAEAADRNMNVFVGSGCCHAAGAWKSGSPLKIGAVMGVTGGGGVACGVAVTREVTGVIGICDCQVGLADPWSASSLPMIPPVGKPIACAAVARAAVAAAADCQR